MNKEMENSNNLLRQKSEATEQEQQYELPSNWCWTKVKHICISYNGKSFKSSEWTDKGLPIVRIQNLNNPNASYNYYSGEIDERFYLRGKELLFAWSGTPGTSFGAHIWEDIEAVLNQHIFKLVFDESVIDKTYLMYAINQQLKTMISNVHGGAGLQHITKKVFEDTTIPLAPLAEQKRIVMVIENIFCRLEEVKQIIEHTTESIEMCKKSILNDAFEGKLTEHWRNEQNIKVKNWSYKKLSSLCNSLQYGTSKKSKKQGTVAVIRMGNLRNGEIDWEDIVYTDNQEDIQKYYLKSGDVLFNRTNSAELVGKTAIYRGEYPAIYAGYLIKLDYGKELIGEYLNYIMNSPQAKNFCNTVKSNGVNQSNINAKKIGNFIIPVPVVEEQQKIVHILNLFFDKIKKMENDLCKVKKQIDIIKDNVLELAFMGKLGTNDLKEEKAEDLLNDAMLFKNKAIGMKNDKIYFLRGRNKMKTSILDALQRFGQLTPEKLKGQTDMNIDDFYRQIKQLVEQNLIEEVRKDGEVYLGVIKHANR